MTLRSSLGAVLALLALAAPAAARPSFGAPPAVAGFAAVGHPLTGVLPAVAGATADDLTLTWERSTPVGFAAVPDAHDLTYVPTMADAGCRLRLAVVAETADGVAEARSEATEPVAAPPRRLRVGPSAGAPARLARWTVRAGDVVAVRGTVPAWASDADTRVVLEPTVPVRPPASFIADVGESGAIAADVVPEVNAVVWLEVATADRPAVRLRLGTVGVRPRIRLVLAAAPDGSGALGRPLVRDLRILPGSLVLPRLPGLRLTWEGRLPGERQGTAVCRTAERVVAGPGGVLRGGCRTRGAWASARWRLVADPGAGGVGATAYLPAASAWVQPRIERRR